MFTIIHYRAVNWNTDRIGGSLKISDQIYKATQQLGYNTIKTDNETLAYQGINLETFSKTINADIVFGHADYLEESYFHLSTLTTPFIYMQHSMRHEQYPPNFYRKNTICLIPSQNLGNSIDSNLFTGFHHSVDTELFKYHDRSNIDRIPVVGFVSRLNSIKLNQNICLSLGRYPNTFIGGSGGMKNILISNGIKCSEDLDYNNVPDFLKELDIFAYPTQEDSFAVVLIEAQSTGLPVVTFDVGGVSDAMQNGITGFLVNSEDEFFQKINLLYNNKELRIQMGNNARNLMKKYSIKLLPERLNAIITSLIGR